MQDNVPFELSKVSRLFNFAIRMSLVIHTSLDSIPTDIPILYFTQEYLSTQKYTHFRAYSDPNFFIGFDLNNAVAISIPRSPFGSFFVRNQINCDLLDFWKHVSQDLKSQGVNHVEVKHPSSIYHSFTDLSDTDFTIKYDDLNQHIDLRKDYDIHKMQERKLKSLNEDGFEFKKIGDDQLETAYKFLTVCRQAQGLQINISWDHLKGLFEKLPGKYECFGVFREEKISALCITVNVTDKIAYYYLPGTSPMFRNQSPMVMLIDGIVKYYQGKEFEYLDMGVSSFEGDVQETLRIFKERMGAEETIKTTFIADL